MSDIKENAIADENKAWKTDNGDWILIVLLMFCFGGWGNPENPRINELEKKVASLEGKISMIGGKTI